MDTVNEGAATRWIALGIGNQRERTIASRVREMVDNVAHIMVAGGLCC